MRFFLGLLVLLVLMTATGSWLRRPEPPKSENNVRAIPVEMFVQGEQPRITVTGSIEKTGVITLVAQAPGIVQRISVDQGDEVVRGSKILTLGSSYLGGNAASVGRQIAEKNAVFSNEALPSQLELVTSQRDIANASSEQSDELKDINRQTLENNRRLLDIQRELLSSLDAQLVTLENTNVGGSNDSAIEQAKSAKVGLMAGIFQLEAGVQSLELSTDDDGPVQAITRITKASTLKQLELQEKSLRLGNDIAQLNLKLSRLSEAAFYPVSPVAGVVERIYVRPGQSVNPGTPLALIRATEQSATVVISLPSSLAKQVSLLEPAILKESQQDTTLSLEVIGQEPSQGSLVSAIYRVPAISVANFSDGQLVEVSLAIGSRQLSPEITIPLKAVYQTQDQSFVYVASDSAATVKTIQLGQVTGEYVAVMSGLAPTDRVILTRGVTQGDLVEEN